MYPRFQTNNREKNTDKLCDTFVSTKMFNKKLKVMMKTTKTTFWQVPSKHREELAGFPCCGTL